MQLNLEDLCHKSKIQNFNEIKNKVLFDIEQMGKFSYINKSQCISHTDWHLNTNYPRKYMDHLRYEFERHSNELVQKFGYMHAEFQNYWFQQYEAGDWHMTHNHLCSYSNVAYIELPNKSVSTKFIIAGKKYSIDVEEGDILSFPGLFVHESPINTGGRKTVVVLNTNTPLDY